jgi:hypothetical protein
VTAAQIVASEGPRGEAEAPSFGRDDRRRLLPLVGEFAVLWDLPALFVVSRGAGQGREAAIPNITTPAISETALRRDGAGPAGYAMSPVILSMSVRGTTCGVASSRSRTERRGEVNIA